MGINGYLTALTHGPLVDCLIVAGGAALLVTASLLAFLPRHRRDGNADEKQDSHSVGHGG